MCPLCVCGILVGRKSSITQFLLPQKSGVIFWNHAGEGPRVISSPTILVSFSFYVWFISLSKISSSLIHILQMAVLSFVRLNSVLINNVFVVDSPITTQFPYLVIFLWTCRFCFIIAVENNNAAMNLGAQVFLWGADFISFELAGLYGSFCFQFFEDHPNVFF
jgi:hypothetical protein